MTPLERFMLAWLFVASIGELTGWAIAMVLR